MSLNMWRKKKWSSWYLRGWDVNLENEQHVALLIVPEMVGSGRNIQLSDFHWWILELVKK